MTACGSVAAAVTVAVCAPAEPAPAAEKSELEKKEDDLLALEDGPLRYVVYARRAVQAFLVKGRLVAYSSDVGESVRPVVPPSVVRFCYGITWAYVAVDVGFNGFEEQSKGSPPTKVARTVVHTTAFQVIASVLVPSLIIHQAVHMAQQGCQRLPPGNVAKWLPSLVGLALIPLMPYIDHPVEHVIDVGFEKAWPKEGPPPWVAVMDMIDKQKKE